MLSEPENVIAHREFSAMDDSDTLFARVAAMIVRGCKLRTLLSSDAHCGITNTDPDNLSECLIAEYGCNYTKGSIDTLLSGRPGSYPLLVCQR